MSSKDLFGVNTGMLRFATAGSVDDGKSTLIGRLLYDSKQVLKDQLEHVEHTSQQRGDEYLDLSLLTDGLRAEREQGITIDVAYRYFNTAKRKFILADTPGHVQYTRNMVTGASTADLSIVLIDARNGVIEQSRRHTFIASLLRVPHVVVAVNKMDLVNYDQAVFDSVVSDFSAIANQLGLNDVTYIPISALVGDNVVNRSESMPWYSGTTVLNHLETVEVANDRNLKDARLPVQWVNRPMSEKFHDYRGYSGQLASGVFRVGDEVTVLPSGQRSRVKQIDTFDGQLNSAVAPQSITLLLEDDIDVSRGDTICGEGSEPAVTREFTADICWMGESPMNTRGKYTIKQSTTFAKALVESIDYRIDIDSYEKQSGVDRLELNDIAQVKLRTSSPLVVDHYSSNYATGAFILIDDSTNNTVAAGMIKAT